MMKVVLTTMIVIVFFTLAMLFSASNEAMVELNYLVGNGTYNVSYLIGLSFVSGFFICWIVFYSMYLQLKLKMSLLRKKMNKLEAHNTNLIPSDKA
jgi:uncharacterized membrane protein YciS (DUF1049 family)